MRLVMLRWLMLMLMLVVAGRPVIAHPAPFSYLDVRIGLGVLGGSLVVHDVDVAHELKIEDESSLADPAVVQRHTPALAALLASRLELFVDGRKIVWTVVEAKPRPERSGIELTWESPGVTNVGRLTIRAALFPYDPEHQTFVNVYENVALVRQEVLNRERATADVYTGSRQGALAVFRAFTASGIHHIAIGPDHILFVVGLLLLGGSIRRLLAIVSAFTIGHSVTLTLATLGVVNPPASVIEPAIALSIVYVGADNLLMGAKGRDVRAWVALFFGLVHGVGFASVLREMGLPPGALGLSLFSFNLGVEIGQAIIVVTVASVLSAVRARSPQLARRLVVAGSLLVTIAGCYWFVQRVLV